jgi:hypothetical protein
MKMNSDEASARCFFVKYTLPNRVSSERRKYAYRDVEVDFRTTVPKGVVYFGRQLLTYDNEVIVDLLMVTENKIKVTNVTQWFEDFDTEGGRLSGVLTAKHGEREIRFFRDRMAMMMPSKMTKTVRFVESEDGMDELQVVGLQPNVDDFDENVCFGGVTGEDHEVTDDEVVPCGVVEPLTVRGDDFLWEGLSGWMQQEVVQRIS